MYSPWNSPGQDTGTGSPSLLQGVFPTQGSHPGLLHHRQILYQLSHKESPRILEWVAYPFSSGSSWPRNRTRVSCIAGRFFTNWAIREDLWIWELDRKEGWALKNWGFWTVVLEKTFESLWDSKIKSVNPKGNHPWMNIHWKHWCWSWSSNTLATWYEEPTHRKRLWYWERLKTGEEGGDRGWDGWVPSLIQWTWT